MRPHLRAPPLRRGTFPYEGFDFTRPHKAPLKRASASEITVLNYFSDVLFQTVLYCSRSYFLGKMDLVPVLPGTPGEIFGCVAIKVDHSSRQ